jgi:hypothetical protein
VLGCDCPFIGVRRDKKNSNLVGGRVLYIEDTAQFPINCNQPPTTCLSGGVLFRKQRKIYEKDYDYSSSLLYSCFYIFRIWRNSSQVVRRQDIKRY